MTDPRAQTFAGRSYSFLPRDLIQGPDPLPARVPALGPTPRVEVTLPEAVRAGFRTQSSISAVADLLSQPEFRPEDGYDVVGDPQTKGYEGYLPRLVDSQSKAETEFRLRRIDTELEDERVLSDSGFTGVAGSMIGGLANPSTFTPLPFLKTGGVAKRFLMAGAAAGAIAIPEEAILQADRETRDLATSAYNVGAAALLGGTLAAALGRRPAVSGFTGAPDPVVQTLDAEGVFARASVGAAEADPSDEIGRLYSQASAFRREAHELRGKARRQPDETAARSMMLKAEDRMRQAQELEGRARATELHLESVKPTGTGIENIPFNPVLRLLKSPLVSARRSVAELVNLGGVAQQKNVRGVATARSAETEWDIEFAYPTVQAIREVDGLYLAYRGRQAKEGDLSRTADLTKLWAADKWKRFQGQDPGFLSYGDFRAEVAKAMRRGDRHQIPEVASAAKAYRRVLDNLKDQAHDTDLFFRPYQNRIKALQRQIEQLKMAAQKSAGEGDEAAAEGAEEAINVNTKKIAELEEKIERLREFGPTQNTAESYFPRMWRHDLVTEGRGRLREILAEWLATENRGITAGQAREQADEIIDAILKDRPYVGLDKSDAFEDLVGESSVLRERLLSIPDELVEEFLENDAEVVARYVSRSLGMDVVLQRRFGDISLRDLIQQVQREAEVSGQAVDREGRKALNASLTRDLEDIRALRDRLRGTYGLPQDPFRPLSRAVRIAKILNVLAMGGGFTISAIPDMARQVMAHGLSDAYGKGFQTLFSGSRRQARKMMKRELEQAGVALDMVLGTRALQFADLADVFGRRYPAERALMQGSSMYFVLNGLHLWNSVMKEWAGTTVGVRLLDFARAAEQGKLPALEAERLARLHLDENLLKRIAHEAGEHGEDVDGVRLPNTELWQDVEAARAYRAALLDEVNRIIVTPGAGDRPLIASNEFGSLVLQFKSFGMASMQRVLISGLQEQDQAFIQGLLVLVALGGITNAIKRQQFGDTQKRGATEQIIDAIDRSGALGWFMDVNNTAERIFDYKVGIRPLLGDEKPYNASTDAKLGALFGPTGSQVANFSRWAGDVLGGEVTHVTMARMRRSIPGQNHPLLDPVFDATLGQ